MNYMACYCFLLFLCSTHEDLAKSKHNIFHLPYMTLLLKAHLFSALFLVHFKPSYMQKQLPFLIAYQLIFYNMSRVKNRPHVVFF